MRCGGSSGAITAVGIDCAKSVQAAVRETKVVARLAIVSVCITTARVRVREVAGNYSRFLATRSLPITQAIRASPLEVPSNAIIVLPIIAVTGSKWSNPR